MAGHDLLRDGRYDRHCPVSNSGGESGDGHRITVQQITIWNEQMECSVAKIATLYGLTSFDIYVIIAVQ